MRLTSPSKLLFYDDWVYAASTIVGMSSEPVHHRMAFLQAKIVGSVRPILLYNAISGCGQHLTLMSRKHMSTVPLPQPDGECPKEGR